MSLTVLHGDCAAILPTFAADAFDAIVTDPPYHLTTGKKGGSGEASLNPNSPAGRSRVTTGFMGKSWDGGAIAHDVGLWRECRRVAKPGAYLVSFGGTRTFHRLTCAIEDAGWEIRDCLMWLYGCGFPKSLNLEGGLGTALKPAWEPIILARKPLIGTVAANVQEFGTGALRIDECRIGNEERTYSPKGTSSNASMIRVPEHRNVRPGDEVTVLGRWPANLLHDGSPEVVGMFPETTSGELLPEHHLRASENLAMTGPNQDRNPRQPFGGDSGSAARFFFSGKATRCDREEGLDRYLQVSYAEPSWANAVLAPRLLAVTGLSPKKVIEGSTIRDSDGSAWSMCWCGSLSTDPCHPGIQSIIATKTSSTTESRTYRQSARPHTNGCMAAVFGKTASGGSPASCAGSPSPWAQKTGISVPRDGRSTEGADLATLVASWLTHKNEGPEGGGHRVRFNTHPT